ncbi:hypothetical protein UPYG_G00191020 [Umbra pygmaea]|uniref:CDC20/Fizzy WD40 domain-containing protein n=1 Tax=Umbra pygmaea TaxID=75934 RepID=A0ABD0X9F4_UMBPY
MVRRRLSTEQPVASSPFAARGHQSPCLEFDSVCQRLCLDSPPGCAAESKLAQETSTDTKTVVGAGLSTNGGIPAMRASISTTNRWIVPEQDWVWSSSGQEDKCSQKSGTPFSVLNPFVNDLKGASKPQMSLSLPSLVDDYYSHLLDWSHSDMVALALGSQVFLWQANTQSLQGSIHPRAADGPYFPVRLSHRVTSVSWSPDGSTLGIGTKEGSVQFWDVERRTKLRTVKSHLSGVGVLSWNQQILSSGSVLGLIHHHDYRAHAPTVGVFHQEGGVCGLKWSPRGDLLASGSKDGLLSIWSNDLGSTTKNRPLVKTMTQPSAVKALAWCPCQKDMIATGGGRSDTVLRIWDIQSGVCVDSAQTNSQVCSVVWSVKRNVLFTGHGFPHHHITCWSPSPSLEQAYQLHGHMGRVLHLALSPSETTLLSAGADHLGHIWNTVSVDI